MPNVEPRIIIIIIIIITIHFPCFTAVQLFSTQYGYTHRALLIHRSAKSCQTTARIYVAQADFVILTLFDITSDFHIQVVKCRFTKTTLK
jgi:hypothetical protein